MQQSPHGKGHSTKGPELVWTTSKHLVAVGVFSMHCGCCCLRVIEFDLDFIAVHANLLIYL